ncbi:MAG: holo-ACP synthase [Verrucomicrobia bacterium]|nr:holo-ACP synthase [Verrucomicrobiota bacterium]
MILGVGIDIIEVTRIRASVDRFGDRFLKRILLPSEIEYCLSNRISAPHIAARFAAKEAVSKAFGTGIGRHLGWHDIEVLRKESGEPQIIFHGAGQNLMKERGGSVAHISLSHTEFYATAVAILEKI